MALSKNNNGAGQAPEKSSEVRSTYDWSLITPSTLAAIPLIIEDGVDCRKFGLALIQRCLEDSVPLAQLEGLRFIASALLLQLNPENHKTPFKPGICYDSGAPQLEKIYPKAALSPLVQWVESLQHPELRARFMDLVWLVCRDVDAAKAAISAYVQAAARFEQASRWACCAIRLERALRLAVSLGKGGHSLTPAILTEIHNTLNRKRGAADGLLVNPLVKVALEFSRTELQILASYAESAACVAATRGANWIAHASQRLAASCYKKAGLDGQARTAAQIGAEYLVTEAYAIQSRPGGGHIAASAVLEQAVLELRHAGAYPRVDVLYAELQRWQAMAILQVDTHQVFLDGTELVNEALGAIEGRPLKEALLALCALTLPPTVEYLKEKAHANVRSAPVANLFGHTVVARDGRVIARLPPLDASMTDPAQHNALRAQMYSVARLWRGITTQAQIRQACRALYTQGFDALAFKALVTCSPWIPPGHHDIVCRALLAGFQGDILLVAHLVPPQLEAMVRHVVGLYGGPAFLLEADGTQSANTLGPLLSTPEALAAFGEDGIFELKDLLTDALGTNLRNNVAHGLLGDSDLLNDPDVTYAWWLLLRFCLLSQC